MRTEFVQHAVGQTLTLHMCGDPCVRKKLADLHVNQANINIGTNDCQHLISLAKFLLHFTRVINQVLVIDQLNAHRFSKSVTEQMTKGQSS